MASGITSKALRYGERTGRWRRIAHGVYIEGAADPSPLETSCAEVLSCGGVASGRLAAVLLGLDGVRLGGAEITVPPSGNGRRPGVRRRRVSPREIINVNGVPCTDGLRTLSDLAACLTDDQWEQAMECGLRRDLVTVPMLDHVDSPRTRRVLALRPHGALPTDSFLETRMVQLARTVSGLDPPTRQLVIRDRHDEFVAKVDLAWPELGLFIELDGQHHAAQPVHDARRETAVVAATGWLCGRFTWIEVTRVPRATARRLADIVDRARARPVA